MKLNTVSRLVLNIYKMFGLVRVEHVSEDADISQSTNCTLINFVLKFMGPTHEKTLAIYLLVLQVCHVVQMFSLKAF